MESEIHVSAAAATHEAATLRAELARPLQYEATAHAESRAPRAQLGLLHEDNRRLVGVLGSLGVTWRAGR
jgi:hypothetical protein